MNFKEFESTWQNLCYPLVYRQGIHFFVKIYNTGYPFPILVTVFVYSEKELKTLTKEKIEEDYYARLITHLFK